MIKSPLSLNTTCITLARSCQHKQVGATENLYNRIKQDLMREERFSHQEHTNIQEWKKISSAQPYLNLRLPVLSG